MNPSHHLCNKAQSQRPSAFRPSARCTLDSWLAQSRLGAIPIAEVTCEDLVPVAQGRTLSNVFGAQFRVLELSNFRHVSTTSSNVTCRATALLSNGNEVQLRVSVSQRGGRRFYEFSTQ